MSGLEFSSFVHLGWKKGKRAEARFLFLVEAPSPALPMIRQAHQPSEESSAAKDHKVTANTEISRSKHYSLEAVSIVKILANLVIPNLFRDLIYNALGS